MKNKDRKEEWKTQVEKDLQLMGKHLNDYFQTRTYLAMNFGKGTKYKLPFDKDESLMVQLDKVIQVLIPKRKKVILVHSWKRGIYYITAEYWINNPEVWKRITEYIKQKFESTIKYPEDSDIEFVIEDSTIAENTDIYKNVSLAKVRLTRHKKEDEDVVGGWKVENDLPYVATQFVYDDTWFTFEQDKFVVTYYRDRRILASVKSPIEDGAVPGTTSKTFTVSFDKDWFPYIDSPQSDPPEDDGQTKISNESDEDIRSDSSS